MIMLWTTIGFVLLGVALVVLQMRRAHAPAATCATGGERCARCGEPRPPDVESCPTCRAPYSAYALVTAPRVSPEAAPVGGPTRPVHALVRADLCVGCGTCVDACPEPGAIRLEGKRAFVELDLCKGHGRCKDACPVGAIVLSQGDAAQHVEVPDLSVHFESSVPGLYIVGELGGRGLIKNAINEGKLAVEHIAQTLRGPRARGVGEFDVAIVGSGPAGLSAALECKHAGLRSVVFEQGSLSDTIHKYPRKKMLLSEPAHTPLYGDLWVADATKEMLMRVWQQVIERAPLDVRMGHRVELIVPDGDDFRVSAGGREFHARRVVLAMGRRGTPRRLGVPGEDGDGVYYDVIEMEVFAGQSVLVVGGGDSAIETALGLAHQPGTRVLLSYRGADFDRARERNRERLALAESAGQIRVWRSSELRAIRPGGATIERGGQREDVPCEAVIVRIGGDPPAAFLEGLGVRLVKKALAIASALLIGAFAAALGPGAGAQVSPGPLAAAHAKLDGSTQCFQCHAGAGATKTGMDERCLACHTEIATLRASRRGYHARASGTCASCHPDHAGRDFKMIEWPGGAPEKFDHAQAGPALEGAHAKMACRDCHKPALQKSTVAPKIRRVNKAQSWLGLDTACASCHEDVHAGSLGATCLACHTLEKWKPAPRFEHARSNYPLTGKHGDAACETCHRASAVAAHSGAPVPVFRPVPHANCTDCHKDPHAGRMGENCERCHSTLSFTQVKAGGFDHDRTRYALRGAHAKVACADCHDERRAFGAKPRFDACAACHKDAHAGRATLQGRPADCAACHTVASFRPATFTVSQHATSPYPLLGRHAQVACEKCHRRLQARDPGAVAVGAALVDLRPGHAACKACHADAHGGQLAQRKDGGACEACHGVEGFRPSLLTAHDHGSFAFALAGRHADAACAACHGARRTGGPGASAQFAAAFAKAGSAGFVFKTGEKACATCHVDPHGGQFAHRKDTGACGSCHGTRAFIPVSGFDHAKDAGFKLDGAHVKVACAACHTMQPGADGRPIARYQGTPTTCVACHAAGTEGGRHG